MRPKKNMKGNYKKRKSCILLSDEKYRKKVTAKKKSLVYNIHLFIRI